MRGVFNTVRYVLRTGCQWRQLPKDFPPRSTVYNYFWEWTRYGVLDRIHHGLLAEGSVKLGMISVMLKRLTNLLLRIPDLRRRRCRTPQSHQGCAAFMIHLPNAWSPMPEVLCPDGSIAEFPDEMSEEEIAAVLCREFPEPRPCRLGAGE